MTTFSFQYLGRFEFGTARSGFSLGSSHDTSTGDCADSKKHIMSATEGMPSNAADGIKFSTCSIAAFKDTLAKVT